MRRWTIAVAFISLKAFAGGGIWFGGNIHSAHARFSWGVPIHHHHVPVAPTYYPGYWYAPAFEPVEPAPPPQPPPPQTIIIEREAPAAVPAPAPPPQVIIIQQPVAAPPPAPAREPPKPRVEGPRVPGPDVFTWVDGDGTIHYSTRVPATAKGKAKKLVAR